MRKEVQNDLEHVNGQDSHNMSEVRHLILKNVKDNSHNHTPEGDEEEQSINYYKIGVCITIVTAFCTASSSACAQALAGFIPEFELNFFRFLVQFVLIVPVVYFNKLSIRIAKGDVLWVAVTCLIHNIYNVLYYKAAIYLPLGAFAGVSKGFILIIVGLVSLIMTKECPMSTAISVVLCVTGMVLIDQPGFIFQNSLSQINMTPTYEPVCQYHGHINVSNSFAFFSNSSTNIFISPSSNEGIGYAFLFGSSLAASSLYFIINRKLKDIDGYVTAFWIAVSGVILSLLLSLIFEDVTFPHNIGCFLLLLGHGLSAALATTGNVKSLQYISPVMFTLVGSLQVVFLALAQYTFMKAINPGKRNAVEVVGVITVLIGNVASPVYTICLDIYKTMPWKKL